MQVFKEFIIFLQYFRVNITHSLTDSEDQSNIKTMDKKDKDIALFVAFRIEEYAAAKRISGEQVLDLFSQYGVTDYLQQCFEPLHTQGRQWLIAEIDEFIEIRKNGKA